MEIKTKHAQCASFWSWIPFRRCLNRTEGPNPKSNKVWVEESPATDCCITHGKRRNISKLQLCTRAFIFLCKSSRATLRGELNTHVHARTYTHSGAQTVWIDGMCGCGEDDGRDPPPASSGVMRRARSPPPPTYPPSFLFPHVHTLTLSRHLSLPLPLPLLRM